MDPQLEALDAGAGVHLWWTRLREGVDPASLSADERARAAAFVSEPARWRYVAARVALRRLCAGYLRITPEQVSFEYGSAGKPRVAGTDVEVNLAHCEDLAVYAFARGQAVGVDLEQVRALPDMREVARVFMRAEELEAFAGLKGEAQERFFFRLWTRREAAAKLSGVGLAAVLESAEADTCWFYECEPVPGFVMALAMAGMPGQVLLRELQME